MTEQTIQSHDVKLADLFQAFYAVPDYQREFVWETDEVEQLLNDINAELGGGDALTAPEYFIGSVVVCPGADGVMDLIDGQQRMTTLFVTLCAVRDRVRVLGSDPPGAIDNQIAAVSTDALGRDHFRYRLELQYEDSGDVLVDIAEANIDGNTPSTRSIANIINAYNTALRFLTREFDDNIDAIRAFYGYLTNKVKLIRIQTENVAKALKIFETINDRGVGLDSMDLLKNLLFMKANREDFQHLKEVWKEMQDTIFSIREKPLRFLRYFIMSRYDLSTSTGADRGVLREDEIYTWLSRNEELCGYGNDPVGFARELLSTARLYRNFLRGKDEAGDKHRFLENLQLLGGQAARQHLILLLAGRHLSDNLFSKLALEVEDLFFVYVITRSNTRDFERNFANWAGEVRQVEDEAALDRIIEKRFVPAKSGLSTRFDEALAGFYGDALQFYRLKYVLAKLTQHIELQAYGENESTKWLSRFTGGGFDVEHIYPQTPCEAAKMEFGSFADENVTQRLGNLVLVEEPINRSLGNREYSYKQGVYGQSQLLLVRALVERPAVGVRTQIDRAVADLDPFPEWNEGAISKRQDGLATLARSVWHVPPPRAA